jgi:hypothetical protein
LINDTIGEF